MDINIDGVKFNSNVINTDLSNIKAIDWFGKLNLNAVTDLEREYVDKLLTTISLNGVQESVTFTDARLVFVASKILINHSMSQVLLSEYGLNEHLIYLSYLLRFYDANNGSRDELVQFVTMWVSYLVSGNVLSEEEVQKMSALANKIMSDVDNKEAVYKNVPDFIITALRETSKIQVGEVVEPIENKDIQDADLEDREPEVRGESEEREAQIKELKDDIETFQFLIKAGATEEETKELEDALETFYFLLKSLGVDEEEEMAKGGSVKKVKSLKDIQNDPRVRDAYKDNSTGEIGYWMSLKEGYVSAWERGSSVRSEDLAYLKDMLNTPGGIITKEEFETNFSEDEYAKGGQTSSVKYNFKLDTAGDKEDDLKIEKKKINLLRKYIDFDEVQGSIDYEKLKDNTVLEFLLDKKPVMTIQGDFNESTGNLETIVSIEGDTAEMNYHPFDGMGGVDFNQFQKELKRALTGLNKYSAVISVEGYEEYAEDVNGLENAKSRIKEIKGNTKFQVLKGESVGVGKRVDSNDVIDEYAKGGRSRSGIYTITDDEGDAIVERADEEAVILFANTMFYYDTMDSGEEEIATFDEAISALKSMDYSVDNVQMAEGGKIGFDALADKVSDSYEGKKVPKKYQSQYGKTYSEEEADEVGNKVAAKVYRQQLKNK